MRGAALAVITLASAAPVAAEAPFLTLPLICDPGITCVIEDYVDADPGSGQQDYTCGLKSRDGHKGTDFAVIDAAAYEAGTTVIAAAPGVVQAVRDGVPDIAYGPDTAEAAEGRECGNAVRILHDNGLSTLYCHMRQGSVQVTGGDIVARGDPLDVIGMSGKTNYPHIHLGVLTEDGHIDPFAPDAQGCDTTPGDSLWLDPLPYTPTGMFTAGFSNAVPSFEDVQSGAARIKASTPDLPIVLYTHFYYAEVGDDIAMQAHGPDGDVFDYRLKLDETRAQMFRAYGRKAPEGGWPTGTYHGTARLERDGKVIALRQAQITIAP